MRVLISIIFSFLLLVQFNSSIAQTAKWIETFENARNLGDLATDQQGFVYVVGSDLLDSITSTVIQDSIRVNGKSFSSSNIPKGFKTSFLAKVDSMGDVKWMRFIASNNGYTHNLPIAQHVEVDNNGDIVISVNWIDTLIIENDTTIIPIPFVNKRKHALVKFDNQGNFKWVVPVLNYVSTYSINTNRLFIDKDNSIYHREIAQAPSNADIIYKVNSKGIHISTFNIKGSISSMRDIVVDKQKNFYSSYYAQNIDTILVKHDSAGKVISALISKSLETEIVRLEIDKNNNIYALGYHNSLFYL